MSGPVLPRVLSPLEQLTPYIAQAGQAAGSAIGKIVEHRKVSNIMDKMQDPNVTDAEKNKMTMDLMRIYSPQYLPMMLAGQQMMGQMNRSDQPTQPTAPSIQSTGSLAPAPEMAAQESITPSAPPSPVLSPGRQKLVDERANITKQMNQWSALSMNPLYAEGAKGKMATLQKDLDRISSKELAYEKQEIKAEASQELKKERQGNLQRVVNEMSSMVAKNKPGIGISPTTAAGINRKGVENRNQFNTMRSRIESVLLPMVNKGTLAKQRFDFIMSQIPEASESQRAIVGKLKGLASSLQDEGLPIDLKILESIPWEEKETATPPQAQRPSLESFIK